jgi:hypothetical protein
MIFQWLSGFITVTLEMKQFHLFIFFRFISILSHLTTVTGRLYFIVDTYVKSRENPEHQYWPDQNRPIREKIRIGWLYPVLGEFYYLYHKNCFHLIYVMGVRPYRWSCWKWRRTSLFIPLIFVSRENKILTRTKKT